MMSKPIIDIVANLNVGSDILKDFIDRVSSGKKIIKYEDGTTKTVTIENAEDATVEGTPINRENLMAMQGFIANNTVFNADGSITETNSKGETLITTFNADGSITETFVGEKTITKTTTFGTNGSIEEVVSDGNMG